MGCDKRAMSEKMRRGGWGEDEEEWEWVDEDEEDDGGEWEYYDEEEGKEIDDGKEAKPKHPFFD